MNRTLTMSVLLLALTSLLPEIVFRETLGTVPVAFVLFRILLLAVAAGGLAIRNHRGLARFAVILTGIAAVESAGSVIRRSAWWSGVFPSPTMLDALTGAVLLKGAGALIVGLLLLVVYRSRQEVYLVRGELSVHVEPIAWLGIGPKQIRWGQMALLSGVLIAGGTLLLTLVTVTGFGGLPPGALERWRAGLSTILLLAGLNALSEGVVYRNGVLGPLRQVLGTRRAVYLAAVFFGVAHFYGAPQGVIGVVMSTLLGWFLCRSMVETRGLAAPWFIHFLQDVVIFSTLVLLV